MAKSNTIDRDILNAEPTFRRYRYLVHKINSMSLARALQYEILDSYVFQGDVLDFGGGDKANYRNLIKCSSYKSINIDKDAEPTWVVGIDDEIPCEESSFDTVVSMNTLEHIFDARSALDQMYRVLKPGGELVLSVPFLFPVHGHPDDYFRPTPSWFYTALAISGFRDIKVSPLSWGTRSTSITCFGLSGPAKGLRKHIALAMDLLYAWLCRCFHRRKNADLFQVRAASAFFVCAKK